MKNFNREAIKRMFDGRTGGGGVGSNGADLAGYATQMWVNQNYVSIEFFNRLFSIHGHDPEDESTQPTDISVLPNDMDSIVDSIESMVGFWTEEYLSALGLNSEQGGGGITLNAALASINNSPLGNPTGTNTVLMFNGTTWVYAENGSLSIAQGPGISITTNNGVKTISLTSGVATAGTYKSVTVDTYGRVTAGTNPTTLAGYGITDALSTATTFWGRTISAGAVKGGIDQASYIEFADIASGTTNGGYIDFHYGGNTTANSGDYTSRIIEDGYDAVNSQGTLKINNILWAKLSTGVSIGTSTISSDYKLNVAGYTKTTRLYLAEGVYFEYDNEHDGVRLVNAGFYSDSYVSALGVNSGGGGGGSDYIPLTGSDQIAGSLIPVTTNAHDLGDSTHAWRNIRGNSIYASNSIASAGYVSAANGFQIPNLDSSYVLLADGTYSKLKTVNGYSLFGEGNIDASGGGTGNYLPLAGGVMTGQITSASNVYPSIRAYNSSGTAYAMNLGYYPIGGYSYFSNEANKWEIRIYDNGNLKFAKWDTSTIYDIYHSGNFNPSNYLPLTGGTLSRATTQNEDSTLKVYNTATHIYPRGIEIFTPNNSGFSTPLLMGNGYGLNNMCDINFIYSGYKSTDNAMSLGFYANDNLLYIKANGNIGIGTTSPYRRLSVSSSNGNVAILNSTSTYTCINYYVNDSAKWSVGADGSTNEFYFYSNLQGRSVVEIGSTGQIKSNIATGTSPLSVVSTTLCSNLNADMLDGQHGSYYAAASSLGSYLALVGGTMSGTIKSANNVYPSIQALGGTDGTTPKMNLGYYPTGGYSYFSNETNKYEIRLYDDGSLYLSCFAIGGSSNKIWNAGNDGTGSGLDADLLDGQHASYFATASSLSNYVTLATAQTITGTKTFSLTATYASDSILYLTNNYNGSYARGLDIQMPNAPSSNFLTPILFGVSYGTNNYGTISFGYRGSGSASNFIGFGFYANDNLLNVCASGNVGIGTTSPSYKLDVNGTIGLSGTTKRIYFDSTHYVELDSSGYFHFSHGVYSDGFMSALGLNSGGGSAVDYIPLSGSTSITGDLTPSNNNSVSLGSSSKLWAGVYCTNLRAYGASSIGGNLTMAGNITPTVNQQYGLGTSSLKFSSLHVLNSYTYGTLAVNNFTLFEDTYSPVQGVTYSQSHLKSTLNVMYLDCSNGIQSSNTITSRSDIRLKTIQRYIDYLSVDAVASAPIFDYTWNEKPNGNVFVGTSAQYWQQVLPNAVSPMFDRFLSLDYSATALVSAVITARKVVDHEARIRLLEVENAAFRNEINQLKKVA